ncbi:tol protein [Colletotrichum asianum]
MTRATLPRFLKQKALEPLLRIPETIRDTIELARRLNIRYIWVDAFCLIQDDTEDLLQGISVMDNIFERSWLTAVAASGHTANYGLPGFSGCSRVPREATVIQQDISMTVFMDLDGMLESTVYQTRGWTALYFFENEVFFRCRRADVSECCIDQAHNPSLAAHEDILSILSAPKDLKLAMELLNPLRDYACILEHYTTRVLSDPCDTIRALAGIIRRVEDKLGQEIIEGLPAGRLERFMLFRSASGGNLSRRRSEFPSWSWAGWHDQITLEPPIWREPMRGYTWNETRHWVSWYKRDASGAVRKLSNHYKADGFYSRVPISGCDRYEPKFSALFGINIKKPGQITDIGPSNETASYPVLQFWTLAVYFRVSIPYSLSGKSEFCGKDAIPRGRLQTDNLEEMTESIILRSGGVWGNSVCQTLDKVYSLGHNGNK